MGLRRRRDGPLEPDPYCQIRVNWLQLFFPRLPFPTSTSSPSSSHLAWHAMAFTPRSPWSRARKPDVYSTFVVHGDDEDDDPRGRGGPAAGAEDEDEEDPSSLPPLLQRLPKDFGGASFDDDEDPYSSDPDDASLSATVVVKRGAPASARSPFLDLRRSSPRAAEDDPYSTFVVQSTTRSGVASSSPRESASGTFIRRSGGSSSPRESISGTFIRRTGSPSSPRDSVSSTFTRRTGSPSSPHESFSGTFIRHTSGGSSPHEAVTGGGGGFGSSFWSREVEQSEELRQPSPLMQQQQQQNSRRKPSVSSVPDSITREDPSTKYELLHELGTALALELVFYCFDISICRMSEASSCLHNATFNWECRERFIWCSVQSKGS